MAKIRGNDISMIFQEPMTSLNPVFTVGEQIAESVRLHQNVGDKEADDRALEMMRLVGIPSAEKRMRDYPHQMSGGMRQRVMIGMALSCNPKLLIADEPTTALDVTVQAQILELMKELREQLGMAILLITHDLGVVAEMVDEVAVMYGGKIVERGPVKETFASPQHPYTEALLRVDPAPRHALHDPAEGDPRHGAEPARLAAGLPVRAALRLRLRPLRHGAAAAVPRRRAGIGLLAVRERPARDRTDRHRLVSDEPAPERHVEQRQLGDAGRRRRPAQRPRPQEVLPRQAGIAQAHHRPAAGRRRHRPRGPPRRDRRARRRVRLRQVDPRAHDAPAARADRRRDRPSTASTSSGSRRSA